MQISNLHWSSGVLLTLCLLRRSLERAEDMILRRIEEGAAKWALRDLRREEETSVVQYSQYPLQNPKSSSESPKSHPSQIFAKIARKSSICKTESRNTDRQRYAPALNFILSGGVLRSARPVRTNDVTIPLVERNSHGLLCVIM